MLSEELLVFVGFLVACGLLVLGLLELVWPTRPTRRATVPSAALVAPAKKRRSKVSPHARPHAGRPPAEPALPTETAPLAARPTAPEDIPPFLRVETTTGSESPAAVAAPAPPGDVMEDLRAEPGEVAAAVETCTRLEQEERFEEVVATGTAVLEQHPGPPPTDDEARDLAALSSLVGLARRALRDEDGAWMAFERAIAVAPPEDRATHRGHLLDLTLDAAGAWMARAEGADAEEAVRALEAAVGWLTQGLMTVPGETALVEALDRARQALWPAYEQAAAALCHRQEYPTARDLLEHALGDPALPPAEAARLRDAVVGTFSGEIGQLTAQAIVSMQEADEEGALATLDRAEALLAALPDGTLGEDRQMEVDQRLWWAYTKLGMRRVDAGAWEAAVEPLIRALRFAAIGPDRREETEATLATALGGLVEERAGAIRQMRQDGARAAALDRLGELQDLLQRCVDLGLSREDLGEPTATVRRLREELERDGEG